MRVSRKKANENRDRVLQLAAQRFREHGIEAVGVAELMREAGLTHGGFYKQFGSKDELVEEACAAAIGENLTTYKDLAGADSTDPWKHLLSTLLSEHYFDNPGHGCLLAALGPDIARGNSTLRREVTTGIRELVDCLALLIPGCSKRLARRRAISAYATIVGAFVVARVVESPELAREVIHAARATLMESLQND